MPFSCGISSPNPCCNSIRDIGVGVAVGVKVGVGVFVRVGVAVGVLVGDGVGVLVRVAVGTGVSVSVGGTGVEDIKACCATTDGCGVGV